MKKWHGDDIEQEAVIEPESEERGEERAEDTVKKLRDELSACRHEKQENLDGWQRAKADYVNLLKRIETDGKASELKGKVGAVETLLPAFDALERAKEHGEVPEGFLAIAKQLEGAFASLGLVPLGEVGEKFDPAHHDALGQDPTDDEEADDTVTAVLEKGWKVGDAVIRPAKVRVAHFASE
ncbi:MAG TPA: nucleotide exchange factor GrpE [Candidatus Paceibacterota bacterium]|nr:MAG: nucleotide exchange factor GrpE [Parcubacteria group bacterium 21-58-10]HQT82825.1 nucleotide exchange factor GrpE [Candidatus Paceibacterota bacterium]